MEFKSGDFRGGQPQLPQSVMTIGNFDGVHLGHQELLRATTERAQKLGLPATVLTFAPHPSHVLSPPGVPMIDSPELQSEKIMASGVDYLFVQKFDEKFSQMLPEDFLRQFLFPQFSPQVMIVGDDFSFGRNKGGLAADMAEVFASFSCELVQIPPVTQKGLRVSSSAIRNFLSQGEVEKAQEMLGRPYMVAGQVVHGKKLGAQLGFPTANIQSLQLPLIDIGVYVAYVEIRNETLSAVVNVGRRPTVNSDQDITIECHILNFDRDLYGQTIRVEFLKRLRPEKKFADLDQLRAQINQDILRAQEYFAE